MPEFLKYTTIIANPIAASAAATVKINKVNTCPVKLPKNIEKETKFIFTASILTQYSLI